MSTSISFDILARDRNASSTFRSVGDDANRAGDRVKAGSLVMKGALVAAGMGLMHLGTQFAGFAGRQAKEFVTGAMEDARAAKSMALSFRNNADASKAQIAATEDWITKMGVARGVADDELRPSLSKLVGATHDISKAQDLTSLAMDISAAKGKSLSTVTEALMKAQNGSVSGLSRLGVATKNAAGETLSFDQIQKDLAKTFGGQSAAGAQTAEGRMQRLKLVMSETGEAIGYKLLPYVNQFTSWALATAVPVLDKLWAAFDRNGIDGLVAKVEKLTGTQGQLTPAWEKLKSIFSSVGTLITGSLIPAFAATSSGLLGAVSPLNLLNSGLGFLADHGTLVKTVLTGLIVGLTAYKVITLAVTVATKVWAAGQWLLNAALTANPIGLVVVGIGLLVGAAVLAYKKVDWFRTAVDVLWAVLKPFAVWLGGKMLDALGVVKDGFTALGKVGIWLWNNALQPTFKFIVSGIAGLLDMWSKMLGSLAKVPGFGWAKGAAEAMGRAADKAWALADKINKIPANKNVVVNVKYTYSGLRGPGGSGSTRGRDSGYLGRLAGGRGGPVSELIKHAKGNQVEFTKAGEALFTALAGGFSKGRAKAEKIMATVTESVKAKVDKWRELIAARDEFAAGFSSFGRSIFGGDYSAYTKTTDAEGNESQRALTIADIIAKSQDDKARAQQTQANVQALIMKGLSKDLIRELQAQGDSGIAQLDVMASASADQIAAINANYAAATQAIADAGVKAAEAVYGDEVARAERDKNQAQEIATALDKLLEKSAERYTFVIKGNDLVAVLKKRDRTNGKDGKD